MIRVVCELGIVQDDQRTDLLAVVDQMAGPQTLLPRRVLFQAADTPERLERSSARLRAYAGYMAANRELLLEGLASGLTAPRIVAERTVAQLERLLEIPAEESIVTTGARVASEADRARISGSCATSSCRPIGPSSRRSRIATSPPAGRSRACGRRPTARPCTGPRSWPGRRSRSSPRRSIGSGSRSSKSIDIERRAIARAEGFGDDTAGYRAAIAADPANIPATPDELLARAAEDIDRAMALAPRYFGRLPRAALEVKAVEAFKERDSPFAYYIPPTTDGSRSGIYYANTYDLPSRVVHQARLDDLPRSRAGSPLPDRARDGERQLTTFRRLGSRLVGGAYVEGWGLYAERLADEMGLYRSQAERFGMLDGQAWRAARLVVDSGLHGLRWPRQRSIDTLLAAGLSATDAVIETDRYIAWPGQALTYKLGQREIERLRAQITARDGRASTCAPSTTRCWATARCPWRRSLASCRTGWPRPPDDRGGRPTRSQPAAARIVAAISWWPARSASSAAVRMSSL